MNIDSLPPPDEMAEETAASLRAAFAQFVAVADVGAKTTRLRRERT